MKKSQSDGRVRESEREIRGVCCDEGNERATATATAMMFGLVIDVCDSSRLPWAPCAPCDPCAPVNQHTKHTREYSGASERLRDECVAMIDD